MSQITRYGKMTAREGKGQELERAMLAAAEELKSDPGCELYLINRQADDPATLWVTEVWRSQEDLDASVEKIRTSDEVAQVVQLVAEGGMVELELLGGKGARDDDAEPASPHTIKNLADVTDMAATHGFGEMGSARFANGDLETVGTGVSHHELKPDARQPFGHRHEQAEEVYLVLSGSGRVKLDDEVIDVGELDAIRVAPGVTRAFEAGADGLELLAFGPRHEGDGEIVPGWWSD